MAVIFGSFNLTMDIESLDNRLSLEDEAAAVESGARGRSVPRNVPFERNYWRTGAGARTTDSSTISASTSTSVAIPQRYCCCQYFSCVRTMTEQYFALVLLAFPGLFLKTMGREWKRHYVPVLVDKEIYELCNKYNCREIGQHRWIGPQCPHTRRFHWFGYKLLTEEGRRSYLH